MAVQLAFLPMAVGLLQGARIAESQDLSAEGFRKAVLEYGAALREMGIDAGMYDALHRLFTAASEAGDGETDWTRVAAHVATH